MGLPCKHVADGKSTILTGGFGHYGNLHNLPYRVCMRCMLVIMDNRQYGNPEQFNFRPRHPYKLDLDTMYESGWDDQF